VERYGKEAVEPKKCEIIKGRTTSGEVMRI
jgi:hypothetical protein